MKHTYWNLEQILNHPTNSVEFKVKEAKKWLSNSKKDLQQLQRKYQTVILISEILEEN